MKIIAPVTLTLLLSTKAFSECPIYTPEQEGLIYQAYFAGSSHDLGYTLAAITVRESFVGRYVVRVNSKDGKYGSYGVTHIELGTAMWLEGIESSWEARAELIPKLLNNDLYSMRLSIKKLKTYKGNNWMKRWARYNGKGPKARAYAEGVRDNIRMIRKCYKDLSLWG